MEMNFYLIVRLILIKSEIGSEVNDRPKRKFTQWCDDGAQSCPRGTIALNCEIN